MFRKEKNTNETLLSSGLRLGDNLFFVSASILNNRLLIKKFSVCPWSEISRVEKIFKVNFSVVLSPEDTFIGAIPLPVGVSDVDLPEAAKWAFSKESDLDMSKVEVEVQKVLRGEAGGLLRDSVWVFGVEKQTLKEILGGLVLANFNVTYVDVLASAQRNLVWAEAESLGDKSGAIASFVVGKDFSALAIISGNGDLLFHKQLEWTIATMDAVEQIDKVIVDVQRNIGFFERRLGVVNVSSGYVFCDSGVMLISKLNEVWGAGTWKSARYAWIEEGVDIGVTSSCPWLLGELARWVDEK